jgi:hypothetical protein
MMNNRDKQRHYQYHNVLKLGCPWCKEAADSKVRDAEERAAEREAQMERRKADRRK